MNKLSKIINDNYQYILRGKKNKNYHIFFESHDWFLRAIKTWIIEKNYKSYKYNNNLLELNDVKTINNCSNIPTKVITKKLLNELYLIISDPKIDDFNIIRDNIDKMYDYLLPSTIKNLEIHIKNIDKNNINILIIGAGPVGLFTALYLHEHYNKSEISNKKVNILLLDNRISKEKIRLPYTRLTQFNFDIQEIQIFIKRIFCWKNRLLYDGIQFDFINILENLLYLCAYHEQIPIYFTKTLETFETINNFAIKHNFNYIFNCTGGRLDHSNKLLQNNILEWSDYNFKKGKYEVKLCSDNYYRFFVNNKLYEHHTIILHLFDKNMKQFKVGNIFGFTSSLDDIKLLEKLKNLCFEKNEYIRISKYFEDSNLRFLLPYIIDITKHKLVNINYIKLTYFITNSRHASICSRVINNNLLYIGLGDTLGSSEYGIYFGMKHSILFSKYICNLLIE